jgi:hypothetical protein
MKASPDFGGNAGKQWHFTLLSEQPAMGRLID